jgi:hypothetical protein
LRKIILIASALLMVVSGVAAVSAFEAHSVNVTAHVENALDTPSSLIIGGVAAFPEEWLTGNILIEASDSFKAQERVTKIDYKVCATPKTDNVPECPTCTPPIPAGHPYVWAGGFTFLSSDGGTSWTWVGPTADENPPAGTPPIVCPTGFTGTVDKNAGGTLMVGMDMPVFSGYYIPETDVTDKDRPPAADLCPDKDGDGSVTDDPCVISSGTPTGEDFGLDLIIQVTAIYSP